MVYTCIVLAAFDRCLAGVEVQRLLQARTEGLWQGQQNHVEIELIQALFVLRTIDSAQIGLNADSGKVLGERLEDSLEVWIDQQNLELQRLALGVQQILAGRFPAGLGQ